MAWRDSANASLHLLLSLYAVAMAAISALAVAATALGVLIVGSLFFDAPSKEVGIIGSWLFMALLIAVHNTAASLELVNEPDKRRHLHVFGLSVLALLSFAALSFFVRSIA